MANNIYRFRRLKWGDPEAKLKMMADTPSAQGVAVNWDMLGIVVGLVAIVVLLFFIF